MLVEDKSESVEATDAEAVAWSPKWRLIVSLLLIWHVTAVIVAPMANPPPASDFFRGWSRAIQPYLNVLFINHGYRFFAPEPGPSHIIRYEVTQTDGTTVEGEFPARDRFWPRQLYHRWFMLSETMNAETSSLPRPQEELNWRREVIGRIDELKREGRVRRAEELENVFEEDLERMNELRRRRQMLVDAIGRELLRRYDGQSVRLYLDERLIPTMQDVIDGIKLDDARYRPDELTRDLGKVELDEGN